MLDTITPTGIAVTLGELIIAEQALERLLEVKLPAAQAYHVAKLARLVKDETKFFHERRDALVRELGEPVPGEPGQVRVPQDRLGEFLKQTGDWAAVPTMIAWRPLPLAMLPEMTPADLLRLGPLVSEG